MTDKLSCYSFIPSINFEMRIDTNDIKIDKIDSDAYKVSLTIVNSLHEIIHAEQDIIFFKVNNKYLLQSPKKIVRKDKKVNDIKIKEEGTSFEYLYLVKLLIELICFNVYI